MKKFTIFFGVAILLAVFITACIGTSFQAIDKEYVLTTDLRDGNLVFLGVSDEINGIENPTLSAAPGSTITVTLINGGEGQHDITFPEVNASTEVVKEKGEEASVTFKVSTVHGEMEYFDSVANHAELGMRGVLMVSTSDVIPAAMSSTTSNGDPAVLAAFQKGACGSCHVIAGIPNAAGVIAPDLTNISVLADEHIKSSEYTGSATTAEEYIHESIVDPNVFLAPKCPTGACLPNVMPATMSETLTTDEINSITTYLKGLPAGAYGETVVSDVPQAPTTGADIVRDPTDLPAPLEIREPTTVVINLETVEVEGQLADGTTYTYWTFNGEVPGPFYRGRLGDYTNRESATAAKEELEKKQSVVAYVTKL